MSSDNAPGEQEVNLPIEKLFVGDINVRMRQVGARQPSKKVPRDVLELAASIKQAHRVKTRLVVVPREGGMYEIVEGSRRFAASNHLLNHGVKWLRVLPCVIRNLDEVEARRDSLVENLQRNNLLPYEEAWAYHENLSRYPDKYPTNKALALALGIGEDRITKHISLCELPQELGWRVRSNISTSNERRSEKLLPISHGLLIVRLFRESEVKEQFANSPKSLAKAETLLANRIYSMDQKSAVKAVQEYRNKLSGKESKLKRIKAHAKRPPAKRTRTNPAEKSFSVRFSGQLANDVATAAQHEHRNTQDFVVDAISTVLASKTMKQD
jgi:ParB family chromosome partitioning protein